MIALNTTKNDHMTFIWAKITMKLIFVVTLLDITKTLLLPKFSILMWVIILLGADFATGIMKSKLTKQEITSQRARDTIIKFLQYFGCLGLVVILQNQKDNSQDFQLVLRYVQDGLTILILYIEALSVLENLYEMDKKSSFSQYVIRPLYSLLSMAVRKNSIAEQAREQKKQEPKNSPDEFDEIDKARD